MSMSLVAPHEEVLFQSSSGTQVSSVTLSKDVSEFDAIRIYVTKKDGTGWNIVQSEAPVVTRNGTTGAFGSAIIFYQASADIKQLAMLAWAFVSGKRTTEYSNTRYINLSGQNGIETLDEATTKIAVFMVLGIKYR